jgi:hypothetical protein
MSATNITSKCRIASIELDDAMILAHVANPRWINFSEGTPWRNILPPTPQVTLPPMSRLGWLPLFNSRPTDGLTMSNASFLTI